MWSHWILGVNYTCISVHGVTKSQARLSDFTFTFHFHALEKEMATHFLPGESQGRGSLVGKAGSRRSPFITHKPQVCVYVREHTLSLCLNDQARALAKDNVPVL